MIGQPTSSFSNQGNNYARIVHLEQFDDKGYTNNISLTQARMTNPDTLNPVITHLMGLDEKKFPLLFLTEGQNGGIKYKEIQDIEFDWPVIGRQRNTDIVVGHDYTDGSKPGLGGSEIVVIMKTAWFKNQHTIVTPGGKKIRVNDKPERVGNGFRYRFQLIRRSDNEYLPLTELTPGTTWGMSEGANVSESYSFGNESNKQMPGKIKNQLGILRKSYEVGGNVSNRTTLFQFPIGGKLTNYWLPFEEYQHELQFKQAAEENLWYSTYNRDANGNITTIDPETQLPIPMGAGVIEQIPNVETYGVLTSNTIKKVIREVCYGASDTKAMNIILFTGIGGKEEFSNALMKEANTNGWSVYQSALADTVKGSPRELVFGAYFTQFRHIDGHTVTVKHLPLLDFGVRAEISPKHPITGLPLTSYEMHFLDMSVYDGENNVQLVSQKGRNLIRGVEQGMTLIKGLAYGDYKGNTMDINLATSQDKTSIHYLKTLGIAIRKNTYCFSLYCNMS